MITSKRDVKKFVSGYPNEKSPEASAPIEYLISKDRETIDRLHNRVIEVMLRDPIPVEPSFGKLADLFEDTNSLDLPFLQAKYGERWEKLSVTLKEYLGKTGGKRLRPLFILNSYRMFSHGKQPDQRMMTSGVGVELLHETALLLDDVMDNSTLRRGTSSLWADIANRMDIHPDDSKKIAAELSPLCFSWARHLVVDQAEENIRPHIAEIFWKAVDDTKHGQILDVKSARADKWPELEEAMEWTYLKTSPYSLELPLLLAFYVAGVPDGQQPDIIDDVKIFSRAFGLAFQLHDDLLILRTDQEIGKDSMADAMNGNKTPLAILARKLGNEEQKTFLDSVWGHVDKLTPENIEQLKIIFRETGAFKMIVARISEEVRNARNGLSKIQTAGFDVSVLSYLLDEGLVWTDDFK